LTRLIFTSVPAHPQIQLLEARHAYARHLHYQLTLLHQDNGSYSAFLAGLAKLNLLILDDRMRAPIFHKLFQDLLEILDDGYGRVSSLVASQAPVAD
jgi:hypothetical protein